MAGVKAVLEGKRPPRGPLVPNTPELQRWRDYQDTNRKRFKQPSDTIDPTWSKKYDTVMANKAFGSAFEKAASTVLGTQLEKNSLVMIEDGAGGGGFIPDAVKGPRGGVVTALRLEWGKPYHFIEVKGWADMSYAATLARCSTTLGSCSARRPI